MNTLPNSLIELRDHLKAQATANSTLVLDDTIFSANTLSAIRIAFVLSKNANLTIKGVKSTDTPDPSNGVLFISAGTADGLNQTGLSVSLTFTKPANSIEVIISLKMNTTWKFTDSFKGLDLFPFQDLKTSKALFVYTTLSQSNYPWSNDPSSKINLEEGLNFLSNVTFNNSILSALLGALLGTKPLIFYGVFSPTAGQPLPIGTIKAPLSSGTFGVGVAPYNLSLSNPDIAVRIGSATTEKSFAKS